MDNNFVNIDDLVRQRLGGGEERERSGAWLRMQELLEKENRRKPMGLYWKRAMSYVGVVLLLAAVSVGGYEVSSAYRNLGEAGNATNPIASTGNDNTNNTNSNTVAKSSVVKETGAEHDRSKHIAANTTTGKNNSEKTNIHHKTSNNTTIAEKATTSSNTSNKTETAISNNAVNTPENNSDVATSVVSNKQTIATSAVATNTIVKKDGSATVANKTANVGVKHTSTKNTVATASSAKGDNVTPLQPVAANKTTTVTQAAAKKADVVVPANAVVAKNVKKTNTTVAQLPLSAASATPKAAAKNTAANNGQSITALTYKNKGVTKPQLIKPVTAGVSALPVNNKTTNKVAVNKVAANVPTDKLMDNTLPKTKQVIAQVKEPRKNARKTANAKLLAKANAKNHAKNTIAKTATPAATTPHMDVAANVKPITGKKVIKKILIHQTTTGVYPNRVQVKLDTISIDRTTLYTHHSEPEQTTEDGGVAVAEKEGVNKTNTKGNIKNNVYASAKTTGNKPGVKGTGNKGVANNNKGAISKPGVSSAPEGFGGDPSITAGMTASADPAAVPSSSDIVPEASLSAASATPTAPAPAIETKLNNYKKKRGSHMLENLSSMFNDIKYKISGVQFAPGLTAGINGTFFGPNSFKGFQFGFTGAFEMDEKWSFLTELKYYHRMNNNYAMSDTYFDLATKDSIISSFSFSTLHSFELPASIRYTAGHMTFFAGANLVYTLAVNTGPDPVPYQVTSISPNAKTTPSLSQDDFASRFGVGYLFGMSYNVSPNVTLDFRTTQSVWDNMKSSGARSVSEQLYKSPSLQFSIGYRLGANKDKD